MTADLPALPAMPLQRRYSVTGQTPPDDVQVAAIKSPQLQALDTSVQKTSCGLCEYGVDARTSSNKRPATQLPSPSTPSSHELPTKIAKLGLDHVDVDFGPDFSGGEESPTHPFPPEESDWALSPFEISPPASVLCTSDCGSCSDVDERMEDYQGGDEEQERNADTDTETRPDQSLDVDDLALAPPPANAASLPTTLVTLPPELRHQIYRQLPDLVLPYPLIYCLSTFGNNKQHPLASVSRLIRSEALAIFYSYNTWIIKLEFKIMYESFQDWIIRLGEGAGSLRLVQIAVRGSLFKPTTTHTSNPLTIPATNPIVVHGIPGILQPVPSYHPPDGDASFTIDLSEKWAGGRVQVLRNDGTREAGEEARLYLAKLVETLWEKKRNGTLNGQDWVTMVDQFLAFAGWR